MGPGYSKKKGEIRRKPMPNAPDFAVHAYFPRKLRRAKQYSMPNA